MATENSGNLTWTACVAQADDSDDLVLNLPDDLLAHMGWCAGDVLVWTQLDSGAWTLHRQDQ